MSKEDTLRSHHLEQVETLWMLVCHAEGCQTHQLVPLYAVSEENAQQQGQQWLAAQPHRMVYISLRPYPTGFMICRRRLPGSKG
ncbi:MAG: hypothetical protein ABI406_01370 [Ktedonobacteraceae bacterium]